MEPRAQFCAYVADEKGFVSLCLWQALELQLVVALGCHQSPRILANRQHGVVVVVAGVAASMVTGKTVCAHLFDSVAAANNHGTERYMGYHLDAIALADRGIPHVLGQLDFSHGHGGGLFQAAVLGAFGWNAVAHPLRSASKDGHTPVEIFVQPVRGRKRAHITLLRAEKAATGKTAGKRRYHKDRLLSLVHVVPLLGDWSITF